MAAALCIGALTLTVGGALAHKVYIGKSHISWIDSSSTIEIEHTLLWHDVETALTVRTDKRFSFDMGAEVSEPLLNAYIQDRFIMEIDGERQNFQWVGMKFNKDRVSALLTVKLDKPPTNILVLDGLMTDVFDTHKNKVVIEAYGKSWEFDLTRKDIEVKLDLTK